MLTSVLVISQCSFVERILDAQHIMAATMSGELEFDAIAVIVASIGVAVIYVVLEHCFLGKKQRK